ncbi:MAG TPA: inositol monophosphatase family protein [Nocardia sp.]|uniref:inositol monophosphatase family protein n=1 Tax=Nocardia sp. TaxID=1821 RepID=UPI002B4AB4B4|nr:inositol monophosphatase family protein [Nocardia sp.]HLS78163.1 inositol monophosphatase family protein [Nocardia sp.]
MGSRVMDRRALLQIARDAVGEGARLLFSAPPGEVTIKSDRDYVTELSTRIQSVLEDLLTQLTPDIAFFGEEGAARPVFPERGRAWVLDPIDGTSNFIHGLPLCAVSLALIEDGKPVLGVIDAPFLELEYYASEGEGAYSNGEPISVSSASLPGDAIISIGDYAVGAEAGRKNQDRLAATAALASKVERVRMFGSPALDLAWVAEGRTDGCVMLSNKPWDTAAGVIIAREAGAEVTGTDGAPHTIGSAHTVAATPALSPALLELLAESLN